jgi:hypothetical protein
VEVRIGVSKVDGAVVQLDGRTKVPVGSAISEGDAVWSRKIALDQFIVGEEKELVLLNGTADCAACLVTPFLGMKVANDRWRRACDCRRIRKRCRGIRWFAARDGVDDAAHGTTEPGRVAVAENLKLVHRSLRDLGGDASAARLGLQSNGQAVHAR